jgi:hypothetical protein
VETFNDEKWSTTCYIAGPYRAHCEYQVKQNIRFAEDIAVQLWHFGFVPICPHLNTSFFGGAYGLSDDVWLKGDLAILDGCKFVVVLPGWRFSEGTKGEIARAVENGQPVYYWENESDRNFLRYYFREWS